jgi:hypothetical protein
MAMLMLLAHRTLLSHNLSHVVHQGKSLPACSSARRSFSLISCPFRPSPDHTSSRRYTWSLRTLHEPRVGPHLHFSLLLLKLRKLPEPCVLTGLLAIVVAVKACNLPWQPTSASQQLLPLAYKDNTRLRFCPATLLNSGTQLVRALLTSSATCFPLRHQVAPHV